MDDLGGLYGLDRLLIRTRCSLAEGSCPKPVHGERPDLWLEARQGAHRLDTVQRLALIERLGQVAIHAAPSDPSLEIGALLDRARDLGARGRNRLEWEALRRAVEVAGGPGGEAVFPRWSSRATCRASAGGARNAGAVGQAADADAADPGAGAGRRIAVAKLLAEFHPEASEDVVALVADQNDLRWVGRRWSPISLRDSQPVRRHDVARGLEKRMGRVMWMPSEWRVMRYVRNTANTCAHCANGYGTFIRARSLKSPRTCYAWRGAGGTTG